MTLTRPGDLGRGEAGVALPLALVGLITITLLVSAALVTAVAEWAMSRALRDATEALYTAEGGLNAFLWERGWELAAVADTASYRFAPATGGGEVDVRAVRLGEREMGAGSALQFFSVTAAPGAGGGRGVAALVTVEIAMDSGAATVERVSTHGWQEISH